MAEFIEENKIKTIAFFLPQFHSIPENDMAWGKGFTEWTNVVKAEPLFESHYQPRTPLDNNYYNLLDNQTLIWQSKLANKYGIDGFCYYHYWFKNGKQLLEKPAEIMLKNKAIDIPFCFSWANENWSRRWDGGSEELIMEQEYGEIDDWKRHLEYLIPFFKDERYITINGNPLLIIYKPEEIEKIDEMLSFFKIEIKKHGFNDLCLMIQNSTSYFSPKYHKGLFNFQIKFQPFFGISCVKHKDKHIKIKRMVYKMVKVLNLTKVYSKLSSKHNNHRKREASKKLEILDYDLVWKKALDYPAKKELVEGAFVDWDNTPRRKNGRIILGATPEKFEKYLEMLENKVKKCHLLPIIFINAWNEWGESAYLEPDERYKYSYLEAVKRVKEKISK